MVILAYITLVLGIVYAITVLVFFIGLLFSRKGKNTESNFISIIIAARNEEKNIGKLLFDLTHQTFPGDRYEIVIADDCSNDGTSEIVSQAAAEYPQIKLLKIQAPPKGYSPKKHAITKAIQTAKGEIILCTDADCRVGSRWIETMNSYFSPKVGFVVGFSQFGSSTRSQSLFENLQAMDFLQLMAAAAGTCNLGYPLAASGQNLGYRRAAFDEVNGYTRVAKRISGDDVLLLQLIRRYTDWKIVFAAAQPAFAVSQAQPTFESLMHQRMRWASNGSYQVFLNLLFFAYLAVVFLYSLFLGPGLLLAFFMRDALDIFMLTLAGKFAAELLIAIRSAAFFHRFDLLKYFPLWFIAQIPYVIFVGFTGVFGTFQWKNRNHGFSVRDFLAKLFKI